MRTAVITTVHGRAVHLRRQLQGLRDSTRPADLHVIVAIDDNDVSTVDDSAHLVDCDAANPGPLPIAAARNTGARAALDLDAELLVFLDVDCIPSPVMIAHYVSAASQPDHRNALLCGPVTYLPPPGQRGYPRNLGHLVDPHPARPAPEPGQIVDSTDYALFWSLSFALSARTWRRIDGFCTQYCGYGAEDTDFAQTALAANIPMRWVGGAHAFHQFHPVSDPPVEHLHDIVRNAEVFHRRWGWWPMQGWLDAFDELGLIHRAADGRPIISSAYD
jgi:GT2 family glycosyltransferase